MTARLPVAVRAAVRVARQRAYLRRYHGLRELEARGTNPKPGDALATAWEPLAEDTEPRQDPDQEERVDMARVRGWIRDHLSDRERRVVTLRAQGWTYREIGSVIGVGVERARQIERRAWQRVEQERLQRMREAARPVKAIGTPSSRIGLLMAMALMLGGDKR